MARHRWRKALVLLAVCVALSHDGGGPLLGTYRGPGFSVGYPVSWSVERGRGRPGTVAHPSRNWAPDLTVEIHPARSAAVVVGDHLKGLAGYGDLVVGERRNGRRRGRRDR